MDKPEKYLKVERTCRYGHGPLELVKHMWELQGARFDPGSSEKSFGLLPSDYRFSLRLWRCEKCGYIELSDDGTGE